MGFGTNPVGALKNGNHLFIHLDTGKQLAKGGVFDRIKRGVDRWAAHDADGQQLFFGAQRHKPDGHRHDAAIAHAHRQFAVAAHGTRTGQAGEVAEILLVPFDVVVTQQNVDVEPWQIAGRIAQRLCGGIAGPPDLSIGPDDQHRKRRIVEDIVQFVSVGRIEMLDPRLQPDQVVVVGIPVRHVLEKIRQPLAGKTARLGAQHRFGRVVGQDDAPFGIGFEQGLAHRQDDVFHMAAGAAQFPDRVTASLFIVAEDAKRLAHVADFVLVILRWQLDPQFAKRQAAHGMGKPDQGLRDTLANGAGKQKCHRADDDDDQAQIPHVENGRQQGILGLFAGCLFADAEKGVDVFQYLARLMIDICRVKNHVPDMLGKFLERLGIDIRRPFDRQLFRGGDQIGCFQLLAELGNRSLPQGKILVVVTKKKILFVPTHLQEIHGQRRRIGLQAPFDIMDGGAHPAAQALGFAQAYGLGLAHHVLELVAIGIQKREQAVQLLLGHGLASLAQFDDMFANGHDRRVMPRQICKIAACKKILFRNPRLTDGPLYLAQILQLGQGVDADPVGSGHLCQAGIPHHKDGDKADQRNEGNDPDLGSNGKCLVQPHGVISLRSSRQCIRYIAEL